MNKGLLILTQKVDLDDEALGFAHGWYAEFAKHFEKVSIICLFEGRHRLPDNVHVFSLGKECGHSRLTYLMRLVRYSFALASEYQSVFVHMNPIYIILMGPVWKMLGKNVALWYAHGHVDLKLRVACSLADQVFTSTPEGLRLDTPKRRIVGQGIDTERFRPADSVPADRFTVVTVGRLTRSKGIDMLISAFAVFVRECGDAAQLLIAGSPVTEQDKKYAEEMRVIVRSSGLGESVRFVGSLRNEEVPRFLHEGDVFVNAGLTGSLDKAVLEAMAAGLPVISGNDAVKV